MLMSFGYFAEDLQASNLVFVVIYYYFGTKGTLFSRGIFGNLGFEAIISRKCYFLAGVFSMKKAKVL